MARSQALQAAGTQPSRHRASSSTATSTRATSRLVTHPLAYAWHMHAIASAGFAHASEPVVDTPSIGEVQVLDIIDPSAIKLRYMTRRSAKACTGPQ